MGYTPHRKGNNVWAEACARDDSKPTILLDAHIDTVRPIGGMEPGIRMTHVSRMGVFTVWEATIRAEVSCRCWQRLIFLAQRPQPYNLIYLASAEEEVTGAGGVRAVLGELGHIDFGVVGEPTGMNPAVAEKGLMVLDCTAHGRAGHAARNEGRECQYTRLCRI